MGKTGIDEIRFTFRCHLNCTAKPPVANIRLLSVTCSHVYRIHKDIYPLSDERLSIHNTENYANGGHHLHSFLYYLPPIQ